MYRCVVKVDDREYSDRFSFAGLKIAHSKDDEKDSLGYKIRAAMIKAVEKEQSKEEVPDAHQVD